nr:hypothetical protein CFP56_00724 [Quercus suber]
MRPLHTAWQQVIRLYVVDSMSSDDAVRRICLNLSCKSIRLREPGASRYLKAYSTRTTRPTKAPAIMRYTTISTVLVVFTTTTTSALQIPSLNLQPFFSALPIALSDYIPALANLTDGAAKDLRKRQFSNTCPSDFNSCSNLGAVNLCCAPNAVCSADFAGHVACCPSGAACSGTIAGVITAGVVNSDGDLVTATTTSGGGGAVVGGVTTTTAASNGGLVAASTQTTAADTGTDTAVTSGTAFIVGGGGQGVVASPAAGVKAAQIVSVSTEKPIRTMTNYSYSLHLQELQYMSLNFCQFKRLNTLYRASVSFMISRCTVEPSAGHQTLLLIRQVTVAYDPTTFQQPSQSNPCPEFPGQQHSPASEVIPTSEYGLSHHNRAPSVSVFICEGRDV